MTLSEHFLGILMHWNQWRSQKIMILMNFGVKTAWILAIFLFQFFFLFSTFFFWKINQQFQGILLHRNHWRSQTCNTWMNFGVKTGWILAIFFQKCFLLLNFGVKTAWILANFFWKNHPQQLLGILFHRNQSRSLKCFFSMNFGVKTGWILAIFPEKIQHFIEILWCIEVNSWVKNGRY